MNFTTIIDFTTDFYLIGEWPFSYLIKCDKPYSTYWAMNGYFLYTLLFWRPVVRNFIDILTLDILGLWVKYLYAFIFQMLLPKRIYGWFARHYRRYYAFVRQYRP